jgi:hypothetical protein
MMLEEKVEVWNKPGDEWGALYEGRLKVGCGPTPVLYLGEPGTPAYQLYYPDNLPHVWYLVGVNGVDGPLLQCWNLMQNAHTMLSTAIRVEEAHSVSKKNKVSRKESV